jgi:branched-chain amino acid transport system substrate-binding protein
MKRFVYPAASGALLLSSVMAVNVAAQGVHSRSAARMTFQLCTSGPFGVPALKDVQQGDRNGVALAINKWRAKLNSVGVHMGPTINLDDAKADGTTYDPNIEAANALQCVRNKNVIGYVGALNSGATVRSEPITNKAHLVQISMSATNIGLTSVKPFGGFGGRAAQEPATYSGKIKWVTFYRTITTDGIQGPAAAVYVHSHMPGSPKSVYVIDDSLPYGVGLASTFTAQVKKFGITVAGHGEVPGSPDATKQKEVADAAAKVNADMVYCGCDTETTIVLARDLRLDGYTKPYMGGDIVASSAYLTAIEQGANKAVVSNFYATNPGPPPNHTSASYQALYKKYFPAFYKSPGPGPYDAEAYDAAGVILDAVYQAAKAHQLKPGATMANRTTVVKHVRFIHYCGALGCMKFDKNGDTNIFVVSVYKTVNAAWTYTATVRAPAGLKPAP